MKFHHDKGKEKILYPFLKLTTLHYIINFEGFLHYITRMRAHIHTVTIVFIGQRLQLFSVHIISSYWSRTKILNLSWMSYLCCIEILTSGQLQVYIIIVVVIIKALFQIYIRAGYKNFVFSKFLLWLWQKFYASRQPTWHSPHPFFGLWHRQLQVYSILKC